MRNQRGFGFVSVLLTLLILAALYVGYFKMQNTMQGGRSVGISAINASREVACRTQRQQIERDIMLWSVNHPDAAPTLAALQHDGLRLPACPDGGQYSIDGRQVHCSVHR
jgi:type II secretory pathway component PulJ